MPFRWFSQSPWFQTAKIPDPCCRSRFFTFEWVRVTFLLTHSPSQKGHELAAESGISNKDVMEICQKQTNPWQLVTNMTIAGKSLDFNRRYIDSNWLEFSNCHVSLSGVLPSYTWYVHGKRQCPGTLKVNHFLMDEICETSLVLSCNDLGSSSN